jgi:adenylate kinase family enzyme
MNNYKEIKEKLKHVYFINGTAYAGKSTVCKALAKKYDMYHCEENYNFGDWLERTTVESHPNMNYFKTMKNWEEFVTRSKEDYEAWMNGVSKETTAFEIETLLSLPSNKSIIVDTNIPIEVLKEISDYNHVVFMVSTKEIATDYFFNRPDREKQFLFNVIKNSSNPDKNLLHYKEVLAYVNRDEVINQFINSGFKVIQRKSISENVDDKIKEVEKHFRLV